MNNKQFKLNKIKSILSDSKSVEKIVQLFNIAVDIKSDYEWVEWCHKNITPILGIDHITYHRKPLGFKFWDYEIGSNKYVKYFVRMIYIVKEGKYYIELVYDDPIYDNLALRMN